MSVSIELLKRFELLRELPDELLHLFAQQAVLRRYARREVVVDPGESESYLYLLFEGSLQAVDFTQDGREVGLYFIRPGDLCGELALFDSRKGSEFVIALAKSQVVLVPHTAIEPVMYQSAKLVKTLTRRLAQRVHELTEQRSLLALPAIPQRVYRQLWQLIAGLGNTDPDVLKTPQTISLPPTQQEMAIMLNTSRETVTRVFQSLLADDILQRNGNKTLIVNRPDLLWQLAFDEPEDE